MTLYEIDAQLSALIDEETGEISDFDAFDALQLDRKTKCENIALYYKNLTAEAEAIKAEEQKLADLRKSLENKAARLYEYLKYALNGEKLEIARVKCAFRPTKSVECDESFVSWADENAPDLLTYKDPQPNETAIKQAMKNGRNIEHAQIVDGASLSVK